MRERKEIEEEVRKDSIDEERFTELTLNYYTRTTIELLLDIRDLLDKKIKSS